jgi:Domain of unknown function (DUF4326)
MPERIQRKRTKGWRMPEDAIYVGRPTKWGNPFTVEEHGAKLSLGLYRNVINGLWSPILLADLTDEDYVRNYEAMQTMRGRLSNHPKEMAWCELRSHDLACWCPLDQPCHADVLLELANG